jgi:circadian clock protein KaiC
VTQRLERLTTGIPGLDVVLKGGFYKGGLYLIQGAPGTGKTTIANQICFHVIAEGRKAVYVTLLTEYHARMMQYVGRMSFFDESKIPDQMYFISGFNVMRSEGLGALLTLIRREILAKKASVLIVDGLIAAQRAAPDEQAFNAFIHELQGVAISVDCTVFMIASIDKSGRSTPEHTVVDGILKLNDQSFGWTAVRSLQITKIRGSAFLRGKHSYQITDDGVIVYPRTESVLAEPTTVEREGDRRVSSGIAAFDAMLQGGLPEGSTTILVGPSGVGKTTFGLQFLSASDQEQRGLMLGFYEMPSRIRAKAMQICRPLIPLLERGIVEVLWQPPTSDLLDAYAEAVLAAVRRRAVRRLFLDGLGALQKSPALSPRMQQFLPALTNELRARGVTTLYSLEAGNIIGSSSPVSFGDMSVVAENLVSLRYLEQGARLHRIISIMKVRDSDFDPTAREFVLTASGPSVTTASTAEAIMGSIPAHDPASSPKPT